MNGKNLSFNLSSNFFFPPFLSFSVFFLLLLSSICMSSPIFPLSVSADEISVTGGAIADPHVAGYRTYYGIVFGPYGIPIKAGNAMKYAVQGIMRRYSGSLGLRMRWQDGFGDMASGRRQLAWYAPLGWIVDADPLKGRPLQ
jgi:hypothetical protein